MRYINPVQNGIPRTKTGILLVNLGTPDHATPSALKRYLKQFLSDPRVVEAPRLLWWLVLNGVILQFRPKRSAHAYQSVFTEQGSPLLFHTRNQAAALAEQFKSDDIIVDFAMRYGNPSVSDVTQKMFAAGVGKLLVLPLYPQYSASTTASVMDDFGDLFKKLRCLPDFRFISRYADYTPFIKAAAQHIRLHWQQHDRADKLLFSFHGIPKRYQQNGDPYADECLKTANLIAAELGLTEQEYQVTFQSRFGREEWLQPYTDMTLKALPAQNVKSVQVFCPGFAADCLETLEEINVENRHYFIEAGGERYEYITALNDTPYHIDALSQLLRDNLQGW